MGFPDDLAVKNLPVNAGDTGDVGPIPELETPLKEEMAAHSSILAWRNLTDRGAWRAASKGHEESDVTEQLSMHLPFL